MNESYHDTPEQSTKTCSKCHVEKPLDQFPRQKGMKDGHRSDCKKCNNEINVKSRQMRAPHIISPNLVSKICTKCLKDLPCEAFLKRTRNTDGLENYCKKCANVMGKQAREKNPEQYAAYKRKQYANLTPEQRELRREYNRERQGQSTEYHRNRYQNDPEWREHRSLYLAKRRTFLLVNDPLTRIREREKEWCKSHPLEATERERRRAAIKKQYDVKGKVNYRVILARDGYWCHICQKPIDPVIKKEPGSLCFDHVVPLARNGAHTMDNIKPAHSCCNSRKITRLLSEMSDYQRRGPDA